MAILSSKNIRKNFIASITTALRIYSPVRHDCVWSYEAINESTFHPRVASKIVGLAFLSIVTAWEEYLENSFLRYMAGAQAESGYSPKLILGKCRSIAHAIKVLSGAANSNEAMRFTRWNDYDWVREKAEIYFHKGEPYTQLPPLFLSRLKDAQIIRNRVVHSSTKSRNQFHRMTNRNIGAPLNSPMDRGHSPGRYLIYNKPEIVFEGSWIETKDCYWPDIFECYVHMFIEMADIITPHEK